MQLSIIIVSYNTRDILRDCLHSIRDSRLRLSHELIVVDNASTDGSAEMMEQEFPDVILIKNAVNLMFAKANNQAMRIAKGDYFLLLNSDTIIEPGNIEKLYDFIDANQPKVACVGPRVLNKDRTFQSEGHAFYNPMYALCTVSGLSKWPIPTMVRRRVLPHGYPRFDRGHTRQVGWVVGAAMLVDRTVVDQIGMLDETYYFYGEESEWCYRARKRGYQVWVCPSAEVVHWGGASTTADVLRGVKAMKASQYAYHMQRTGGRLSYCATALMILCVIPTMFLLFALAKRDVHRVKRLAADALGVLKICMVSATKAFSRP